MTDRIDRKGNGLNFTLGEFEQVRYTELFQRQKVPPEAFPNGSTGLGKQNFCNWRVNFKEKEDGEKIYPDPD